MKIHNMRYGFASNSSSTHSIIKIYSGSIPSDEVYSNSEYGWDEFILSSKLEKINYLKVLVAKHVIGKSFSSIQNIFKKILDVDITKDQVEFLLNDAYIDHQSMIYLPKNKDGDIDLEFLKEFVDYILNDDIVIFGGNDNSYDDSPFYEFIDKQINSDKQILYKICNFLKYSINVLSKKDKNNTWVLFNKSNGDKIRFSFDNNITYNKSTTPELVDLKITNYCEYNCPFCYQDSDTNGQHANIDNIKTIINELHKKNVFEVALGGGDPLTHPEIKNIIRYLHKYEISTSFTTRNFDILQDKEFFKSLPKISSVSLSVGIDNDVLSDIYKILKYDFKNFLNLNNSGIKSLGINIIFENLPDDKEYLKKIIDTCYDKEIKILFLGYKHFNIKGKTFGYSIKKDKSKLFRDMIDILKEYNNHYLYNEIIGIDTLLARLYIDILKDSPIDPLTYSIEEGKFSCYIDAVRGKISKSSYDEEAFDFNNNNWIDVYNSF